MKEGNAAVNLEPTCFFPIHITQPVLALGLSLRGWMLKPLILDLFVGPRALKYFPSISPLESLGFFDVSLILT
jgi:hypothetical protein